MRLLALAAAAASICAACMTPASAAAPSPAPTPPRSWALPQIKAVVGAGLLAPSVSAFRPDERLTQRALADTLELLALAQAQPAVVRYRAVVPERAVTIRELDAALVGFAGLGDAARSVTAQLRAAGLAPKVGAGTEVVARLLGLRYNHPAAQDSLELGPNDAATRAEAAYSLAQLLALSRWSSEWVRSEVASLDLPDLTELQRQVLTRAIAFVGYPYIWGGTSERPQRLFGQSPVPGGFDCSGLVWRVFKLEPFPGASALAAVLRGRTTYELSGEVGAAMRIRKPESLQPGDIVFQGAAGSRSKPAQVDHAGIYLGGGWFVHSSRNGTTLHPFEGWYRERFAWARRPLREAGLA